MRQRVQVQQKVPAPADQVWEQIARVDGWERWISILNGSDVERAEVLGKRVCHTADGAIYETVETLDHELRLFQYSIQSAPMPLQNALGTIHVREDAEGGAEVRWSLNFDADPQVAAELKPMIEGIYREGIEALGQVAVAP